MRSAKRVENSSRCWGVRACQWRARARLPVSCQSKISFATERICFRRSCTPFCHSMNPASSHGVGSGIAGVSSEARPAFYALAPGGWRDYVTLLHLPYTTWHLSYVVIGACLAPHVPAGRLALTAAAFFLGLGVGVGAGCGCSGGAGPASRRGSPGTTPGDGGETADSTTRLVPLHLRHPMPDRNRCRPTAQTPPA